MRICRPGVFLIALGALSCRDSTAPSRPKVPDFAHFMQAETDPTCNYVSMTCPYTIGGVTTWADPPASLGVWPDDPSNIYDFLAYPAEGDYYGWRGATPGTYAQYLVPGGTVVEEACDPRPDKDPNCLLPLLPQDTVFLLRVRDDIGFCTKWFKCGDELPEGEPREQCSQIRVWLFQAITDSFDRPPGDFSRGFFRGRNGSGTILTDEDAARIHGGITNGGSAHADEREWDIYRADSVQMQKYLIRTLAHEAVHIASVYNHHGNVTNPNYGAYPYFKYLQKGQRDGCLRP